MLSTLTRKKPEAPPKRTPLEVLKTKLGNINQLPTLPEAATKAVAVANDPKSSMRDLAMIIESDPSLAASVLKLANSAIFWSGRTVDSLHQAVVRLGLRECQNLITAVGMHSLMRSISAEQKASCEKLWRHSFTAGLICRRLNRSMNLGFQGEEFSCGLMHDIGRILFAIGAPLYFNAADALDFIEGPETLAKEQEILGTDHCFFGAWFADGNQLPGIIVSAIQYHHEPENAGPSQALVGLVAAADHMANFLQQRQPTDTYDPTTNRGWALLSQSKSEEVQKKFSETAITIMDDCAQEAQELVNFN